MSVSSIKIRQVQSKEDRMLFLNVVDNIYKDDDAYIRPLNVDIAGLCFDTKDVYNWIAIRDGICLGRISGFYNKYFAQSFDEATGGLGFYECIDDSEVSKKLFDSTINFLRDNYPITAINGPINNEVNFRFWGMLIEKYQPAFFGQPYNPRYYKNLFEEYGFMAYYEQYYYESTSFELPTKWQKISDRFSANQDYEVRSLRKSELNKAPAYFLKVYNEAWKDFPNFKALSLEEVETIFDELKPILDPNIICFAFYKNTPVAMIGLLPDLNLILQKIKSAELDLLAKLKFLWHKKTGTMDKAMGFIYGVSPKFQRLGINAYLSLYVSDVLKKSHYTKMQFAWIGSFNPKMKHFVEQLPIKVYNVGCVYRLLLNNGSSFSRKENVL